MPPHPIGRPEMSATISTSNRGRFRHPGHVGHVLDVRTYVHPGRRASGGAVARPGGGNVDRSRAAVSAISARGDDGRPVVRRHPVTGVLRSVDRPTEETDIRYHVLGSPRIREDCSPSAAAASDGSRPGWPRYARTFVGRQTFDSAIVVAPLEIDYRCVSHIRTYTRS